MSYSSRSTEVRRGSTGVAVGVAVGLGVGVAVAPGVAVARGVAVGVGVAVAPGSALCGSDRGAPGVCGVVAPGAGFVAVGRCLAGLRFFAQCCLPWVLVAQRLP